MIFLNKGQSKERGEIKLVSKEIALKNLNNKFKNQLF